MRTNKMRKTTLSLLTTLALMVLFLVPTPVSAATTADVSVNATPAYISISVDPNTYGFGTVAASSTTNTTHEYFTVTNASTVLIDVTIAVTGATWTGGVAWSHAEDSVPGADIVGLNSTTPGSDWSGAEIIVKNAAPNNIVSSQATTTNFKFGLKMFAPTSFSDGVIKVNTVRLTATAS